MNKGNAMKRAVLYLRVSKQDQSIENQRSELERVANARGWRIVGTFKDEGISGAFGREVRAQYDVMLKQGVQAKYDVGSQEAFQTLFQPWMTSTLVE